MCKTLHLSSFNIFWSSATSKYNETVECQTAFVSNSHEPSKALMSLKNYHVFRYKDSCYFASKFELKFHQSTNECRKRNNSDLFYINNDQEIDHIWHIENKISIFLNQRLIDKENDGTPDEKHYHIGLKFDSQNNHWFWSNGLEFNQNLNQKIKNDISKIGLGFSAYLLFVTGKTTTLAVSPRNSSRKNFICRLIIDHCLNNKKCGPNGSCQNDYFNKGYKVHSECSNINLLLSFCCSLYCQISGKNKYNQKFNLDKYQKKSKNNNFILLIQNAQNVNKICSWIILYDQKTIFIPIFLTLVLYLNKNSSVFETPLDPFSKQDRFITSLLDNRQSNRKCFKF
ncbi:hypothetical protein BpHYR1_039314 [Brachionus plicatilis]|uniref:C-type lectin domain-containing protein n=1 Tax=Brachionus plicatilis TaxID=10195 RepID=A0A3M7QPG4_BRAPC|nr:hypothetical protein BpHYR1_039314 [Brachionus plicatilis]